jgi:hypothetical protein
MATDIKLYVLYIICIFKNADQLHRMGSIEGWVIY